ncbi:class I SAM-dependent methyltransferase [Streptomyces formicae]|uniref:Class I SAM-dependent methyltransferase n=1 Tax=Streptomyces formicae TaxID=1616117 RepID=A0ABY3WT93_9ACTN|nr:class I SAM-dependent methyltransferase [Streptomyces formicae]UNM15869.1 class I SAM-dependent methyltransferase [Streptomyces formicae]
MRRVEATNLLYRDPELYDMVQSDSTSAATCLSLIEKHVPHATTLLDFGCGTGRDLEILAERFESVGVDLQPGMVDYARRTRPGLDIRTGDMRTVRLGKRMDIVTCLGNSLAYVHDNDDISKVFGTFAVHARPGALLLLCSPVAPVTDSEPTTAGIESRHGPARVTISYAWDLRKQINTMHRRWELPSGDEAQDEIRRRVLFPRELELYAVAAGFEVVDMFDEYGTELTGPVAFTVARYTGR